MIWEGIYGFAVGDVYFTSGCVLGLCFVGQFGLLGCGGEVLETGAGPAGGRTSRGAEESRAV